MSNDVNEKIGTVKVADDVVPNIAALAAAEVDGVVSVAENLTAEIIDRMGMRKAPKGVKVEIKGKKVYVDMALGIDYGYNVPETSRKVQEKVKESIETMMGLEVVDVNIHIASVVLPKAGQ
ncbi:MAG: Asp23/Gls24 family envelope stress response protein [Lachnospiraceae bacterium]|jgi:Uncharacterized protein conserved in bacteria|nr:Asp23/Gls24 family envelope stress response protein [Lachnospiraceae bacterium]MBR3638497.1 Asp23/Gls24 family envelope stress response protein [Lachnospiraceae bacterium]